MVIKKMFKCLSIFFICIFLILVTIFFIFYFAVFKDTHTYYELSDCSYQESEEIFNIIGLELPENIVISKLSHRIKFGNDVPRDFSFSLYGDKDILLTYLEYLKKNTSETLDLSAFSLDDAGTTLFFSYHNFGWCELERYMAENGTKKIKYFT